MFLKKQKLHVQFENLEKIRNAMEVSVNSLSPLNTHKLIPGWLNTKIKGGENGHGSAAIFQISGTSFYKCAHL